MTIVRPARTEAHRQRDTYLQQFADLGLEPIISTNGSDPQADIQFVKVPADEAQGQAELHGGLACWVTAKGQARLDAALMPGPREPLGVRLESA